MWLTGAYRTLDVHSLWVRPDVEESILDDGNGEEMVMRGSSADGAQRLLRAIPKMSKPVDF